MAARGTVDITFRTRGQQQVRATIRGVAQEAKKGDASTLASARRLEQQKAALARRMAQIQIRSAQWAAREEARVTNERIRAAERAERERQRVLARSDAAIRRSQREQQRAQTRRAASGRRADARAGTAVMAGAAVGGAALLAGLTRMMDGVASRLDRIATAIAGRTGQLGVAERTTSAMDYDTRLRRASGEFFAGQDAGQREQSRRELTGQITATALETGQGPNEILATLERMQTEFSAFDIGREQMAAIGHEATRTGASMEDLGAFVGMVHQQLGDAAPEASRLFDIMSEQGARGSVSSESMATNFMPMLGQYSTLTGEQGEQAFRNFTGISQALRPAFGSDEEAATGMQSLMSDLGNDEVRARLIRATGGRVRRVRGEDGMTRVVGEGGTQAFHDDGSIDMQRLIQDAGGIEGIGTSGVVFRNRVARQAFGQLASLERRDAAGEDVETAAELAGVSAENGAARRAGNLADVRGGAEFTARIQGVQTQNEGIRNLGVRAREAEVDNAYKNMMEESVFGSMLQSVPGMDTLAPVLARGAQRAGTMSEGTAVGLQAAGGVLSRVPGGGVIGGALGLAGTTGQVGRRMNEQLGEARGIADGKGGTQRVEGEVRLDERTIAAIGTAVGRAVPREKVPGRAPG